MTDRQANKAYYRSRQRCTKCGQQDAFTLNGRSLCAECVEKVNAQSKRYNAEHREERNAWCREWVQTRREAGLCPRCGKPAEDGYIICKRCRVKDNRRREKKRRENDASPWRWQDGICWTCKRRPVLDGKKLCRECYDKSLKSMAKAREAVKDKSVFLGLHFSNGVGSATNASDYLAD